MIEKMAMYQSPTTEIISILGCGTTTLYEACKREKGIELGEYLEKFREMGKMTLRRRQFQRAMEGSDRMLTWLGINHLEQSSDVVTLHRNPGGVLPAQTPDAPAPAQPTGFQIPGPPAKEKDKQEAPVIDAEIVK